MYAVYSPPFSFVAEKNEAGETERTPTGGLFWDGRADGLDAQARGPFTNPVEMANADAAAVVAKVRKAAYAPQFDVVFGSGALSSTESAMTNIATAIAAYESSDLFHPFTSKFDDYLRGTAQLSPQETAGFALFKDPQKGNCVACHAGNLDSHDPQDWLFTDFTYDNLGLPRNADIPANHDAAHFDLGLCQREGLANLLPRGVSLESLCGAFKVPTLRNVAVTAPYFHNGAFSTLKDAVSFYVMRDTNPERWYPKTTSGVAKFNDLPAADQGNVNTEEVPYDRKLGEAPRLTPEEIDDVIAFLNTLTDAAFVKLAWSRRRQKIGAAPCGSGPFDFGVLARRQPSERR